MSEYSTWEQGYRAAAKCLIEDWDDRLSYMRLPGPGGSPEFCSGWRGFWGMLKALAEDLQEDR